MKHISKNRRRISVFALGIAPVTFPVSALAQGADHVVLGAGVAVVPTFQGADDFRVLPIPTIDIKKGIFVASLQNGVGIVPITTDRISIGVSASFIQGYRRRDVPDGIDRLSSGFPGCPYLPSVDGSARPIIGPAACARHDDFADPGITAG